jgi:hypothetical protein
MEGSLREESYANVSFSVAHKNSRRTCGRRLKYLAKRDAQFERSTACSEVANA